MVMRSPTILFRAGPRDGDRWPLHAAEPKQQIDGGRYLLAIVTVEEAVYEWQHEHTGHKRRPTEPCCEPVHAGCPLWAPGGSVR